MGYWGSQPAQVIQIGRDWYSLPHRSNLLIALDGPIMQAMLGQDEFAPFLDQVRAEWTNELNAEGQPESLRLLIARLIPRITPSQCATESAFPSTSSGRESIARQNDATLRAISQEATLTSLPHHFANGLPPDAPCRRASPPVLAIPAHHPYQPSRACHGIRGAAPSY